MLVGTARGEPTAVSGTPKKAHDMTSDDNQGTVSVVDEERLGRTVEAALSGLLPAAAAAAGPAPSDAKEMSAWAAHLSAVIGVVADAAVAGMRPVMRREAALANLLSGFDGRDQARTIQKGIVLDVFTHNGAGVMIVQNTYIPADARMAPGDATERARDAVRAGDAAAFRGDYGGNTPGDLGRVGVERYWLGFRSEAAGDMAYRSAKAAVGQMSRIYKQVINTDQGKKLKSARYVEPMGTWENAADAATDVADMIDRAEDYANTHERTDSGNGTGDDGNAAVTDPAGGDLVGTDFVHDPAEEARLPDTADTFKTWAKQRGLNVDDLTRAKETLGIRRKLSDMTADDIRDIAEHLTAAAAA